MSLMKPYVCVCLFLLRITSPSLMAAGRCRAALLLLPVPLSHGLGHAWSLVHFVQVCECPCAGLEHVTRECGTWPVPDQPPADGGRCVFVAGAERKAPVWVLKAGVASAAQGMWHLAARGIWHLTGFYLACSVLSNSNAWLYVFSLCAKFILINSLYSLGPEGLQVLAGACEQSAI